MNGNAVSSTIFETSCEKMCFTLSLLAVRMATRKLNANGITINREAIPSISNIPPTNSVVPEMIAFTLGAGMLSD